MNWMMQSLIWLVTKKLNPVVTEIFIRGRKLDAAAFIRQSLFAVPKDFRLSSMDGFIMKIPNKSELQQISINHLLDIDFINLYKKYTAKPYCFLIIDTTLPSYNSLHFRCNLLEIT